MLREKIHYLDVRRRPSQSNTFATLPPSLRGSMAYLSSVENRKNLLFIVNFALLVCSLILIGKMVVPFRSHLRKFLCELLNVIS